MKDIYTNNKCANFPPSVRYTNIIYRLLGIYQKCAISPPM